MPNAKLLTQDAPAVLAWLARFAGTWAERHGELWPSSHAEFWRRRAIATHEWLSAEIDPARTTDPGKGRKRK